MPNKDDKRRTTQRATGKQRGRPADNGGGRQRQTGKASRGPKGGRAREE